MRPRFSAVRRSNCDVLLGFLTLAAATLALASLGGCPQNGTSFSGTTTSGTSGSSGLGGSTTGQSGGNGSGTTKPLYITTMTHMEGNFMDDRDQAIFQQHVTQMQFGMSLADEYGAKLTFESERPFARACTNWGYNALADVIARGHGVGTHCDIAPDTPTMSVDQYAQLLAMRKIAVDELVGAENNRGFSGGGSDNDWVQGGLAAGFAYATGIVGLHYLPMPMSARPDSSWTDDFILAEGFHYNAPHDLYDRIYPRKLADAQDFVEDANGAFLLSAGDLGRLDRIEEGEQTATCGAACTMTTQDVDLLIGDIAVVIASRDVTRMGKITVYFAVDNFTATNEYVLRYFFAKVQELVESGSLVWGTQGDVLDAYNSLQATPQ